MKTPRFLVAACISLALAFTFSCSSDDGNDPQPAPVQSSSSGDGGGPSGGGSFTDPRDSKTYRTVVIGTQTWMAQNLNFAAEGSKCYDNSESNCETYGRLYNWATAMANSASSSADPSGIQGVCPPDWHLPSDAEWTALTNYVESEGGCSDCAGTRLKAKSGWSNDNGTDNHGFSALPGGGGNSDGSFYDVGSYGSWWTSSEYSSDIAYSRFMSYFNDHVHRYNNFKTSLLSVRCLQD